MKELHLLEEHCTCKKIGPLVSRLKQCSLTSNTILLIEDRFTTTRITLPLKLSMSNKVSTKGDVKA